MSDFCRALARKFELQKPTEIKWYHGCNTLAKLDEALISDCHMLEVDVAFGPYDKDREPSNTIWNACLSNSSANGTRRNLPVELIMAHPPQQPGSNLTFRHFCETIKKHNEAAEKQRKQGGATTQEMFHNFAETHASTLGPILHNPQVQNLRDRVEEVIAQFGGTGQDSSTASGGPSSSSGSYRAPAVGGPVIATMAPPQIRASRGRGSTDINPQDPQEITRSAELDVEKSVNKKTMDPSAAGGTTGPDHISIQIDDADSASKQAKKNSADFTTPILVQSQIHGKEATPTSGSPTSDEKMSFMQQRRTFDSGDKDEDVVALATSGRSSGGGLALSSFAPGLSSSSSTLQRPRAQSLTGSDINVALSPTTSGVHLFPPSPTAAPTNSPQRSPTQQQSVPLSLSFDLESIESFGKKAAMEAANVGKKIGKVVGKALGLVLTVKGVKFDFKSNECVRPAVEILLEYNLTEFLPALMMNADILYGPMGAPGLFAPQFLDGEFFVKECSRLGPGSSLSLGWMSTDYAIRNRHYRTKLLDAMVKLCQTNVNPDPEDGRIMPLCETVTHITFAVCAPYVMRSRKNLKTHLLEEIPNSSLTVFTGAGSLGVSESTLHRILSEFDNERMFIDVQIQTWIGLCCGCCTCGVCNRMVGLGGRRPSFRAGPSAGILHASQATVPSSAFTSHNDVDVARATSLALVNAHTAHRSAGGPGGVPASVEAGAGTTSSGGQVMQTGQLSSSSLAGVMVDDGSLEQNRLLGNTNRDRLVEQDEQSPEEIRRELYARLVRLSSQAGVDLDLIIDQLGPTLAPMLRPPGMERMRSSDRILSGGSAPAGGPIVIVDEDDDDASSSSSDEEGSVFLRAPPRVNMMVTPQATAGVAGAPTSCTSTINMTSSVTDHHFGAPASSSYRAPTLSGGPRSESGPGAANENGADGAQHTMLIIPERLLLPSTNKSKEHVLQGTKSATSGKMKVPSRAGDKALQKSIELRSMGAVPSGPTAEYQRYVSPPGSNGSSSEVIVPGAAGEKHILSSAQKNQAQLHLHGGASSASKMAASGTTTNITKQIGSMTKDVIQEVSKNIEHFLDPSGPRTGGEYQRLDEGLLAEAEHQKSPPARSPFFLNKNNTSKTSGQVVKIASSESKDSATTKDEDDERRPLVLVDSRSDLTQLLNEDATGLKATGLLTDADQDKKHNMLAAPGAASSLQEDTDFSSRGGSAREADQEELPEDRLPILNLKKSAGKSGRS